MTKLFFLTCVLFYSLLVLHADRKFIKHIDNDNLKDTIVHEEHMVRFLLGNGKILSLHYKNYTLLSFSDSFLTDGYRKCSFKFQDRYGNNKSVNVVPAFIYNSKEVTISDVNGDLVIPSFALNSYKRYSLLANETTTYQGINIKDSSIELHSHVVLYPNPSTDYFEVRVNTITNNRGLNKYEIFDLKGNSIMAGEFYTNVFQVEHSLSSGVYLLKISMPNTTYDHKFQVRK